MDEYRDIYQEHGYFDRAAYLLFLSEEYYIEHEIVLALADVLGPEEDFDGLVSTLEDTDMNYL